MAQWMGQFSGHTHETKVEDAQDTLRRAVDAFRSADPGSDREKKWKTVKRLANRLMAARLKLARARLVAAKEGQSGAVLANRSQESAAMERTQARLLEEGLDVIFREFGVENASPG